MPSGIRLLYSLGFVFKILFVNVAKNKNRLSMFHTRARQVIFFRTDVVSCMRQVNDFMSILRRMKEANLVEFNSHHETSFYYIENASVLFLKR